MPGRSILFFFLFMSYALCFDNNASSYGARAHASGYASPRPPRSRSQNPRFSRGPRGRGKAQAKERGAGKGRSRSRREPSRRAEEKGKGRQEGARRSGRRPEQERDPGTRRSGRAGRGEGRANQQARGEEERGRAAHAATEPEIQMEKVPGQQILASFTLSVPTGRFTFGERLARGHQGEQQEVPGPQILASGAATPHAPC